MAKHSSKANDGAGSSGAEPGERGLRVRISKGRLAGRAPDGVALVRQMQSAVKRGGRSGGGGLRLVGRGAGAGGLSSARAQRVMVKARVVALPRTGGKAAVMRYLDYIEREGGAKDGGISQRFGADSSLDDAGVDSFAERCAKDRHSFRLIVSPENGNAMDLQEHTRGLMRQMERDLGTKLEWVAATHHDTDNPHIHILVRGVDERGGDLVISKDYISNGIRARAGELATLELGYRNDIDVVRAQQRAVNRSHWTGIDAELMREQDASPNNRLDFARTPKTSFAKMRRDVKLQRLAVLQTHGLAEQVAPGRWRIADGAREVLQNMSAEQARWTVVAPHVEREGVSGYELHDKESIKANPVHGIVLDRGLANPLSGTEYVVVGGFDGRVHYATVGHYSERHLSGPARVGDTIHLSVVTPSASGAADRNVLKRLNDGIYDPEAHLAEVLGWKEQTLERMPTTPEAYVEAHRKRMDALASRGHVEALPDGRYRVPADLQERLSADPALNRDRQSIVRLDVDARGPLAANARVVAQTFLDDALEAGQLAQLRELHDYSEPSRSSAAFLQALEARTDRLIELGLAERDAVDGVALAQGFRGRLRALELAEASSKLASEYGQPVNLDVARRFEGRVARIEALPSGPHAVITNEDTFALVPAKFGLERMVGQDVQVSLARGEELTKASFQQARLRIMAMDEITPNLGLGLGLERGR